MIYTVIRSLVLCSVPSNTTNCFYLYSLELPLYTCITINMQCYIILISIYYVIFLLFCLASHGCWKEGYLVFTPGEIKLQSGPPQQSSYILTLEDILHLKLRAKIVVLNVGYGPNRSKECIPPGFALPSAFLNAGKKLKTLYS